MASFAHAHFSGRPWAATNASLALVIDALDEVGPTALQSVSADRLDGGHGAERRGAVGVLHLKGPLFKDRNLLCELLDGTSYERLALQLQSALDARDVGAILFVVDSAGGEVAGCAELAEMVYKARGRKPMAAFIGGTGASAAYWIASAVGSVYVDPTAIVGSIGCKAVMVDDRGAQEQDGRKRITVVSSQSPNKGGEPSDKKFLSRVQVALDDTAGVFIDAVAKYRGVRRQTVLDKFGQGDVMVGQRAVSAGLADELRSCEAVIADLAAKAATNAFPYTQSASSAARAIGAGGTTMTNDKDQAKYIKLCEKRGLDAAHPDTRARVALSVGLGPLASLDAIVDAARAQKKALKVSGQFAAAPATQVVSAEDRAMNKSLGLGAAATENVRQAVIDGAARIANVSTKRAARLATTTVAELEQRADAKRAKAAR